MSQAASQLASQSTKKQRAKISDDVFFAAYSRIGALAKMAKKTDEAISAFHRSRQELETEQSGPRPSTSTKADEYERATNHALLALLHWLYPNYPGYNRLKNAKRMFEHASAAAAWRPTALSSIPFAVGVTIQLRILPFLVRSNKASPRKLARVRAKALSFIEHHKSERFRGSVGLIYDGVGTSYSLLERDMDAAISYLSRSATLLVAEEKSLARGGGQGQKTTTTKRTFYRAFASTVCWDLGICYENLSEKAEGDQMLSFLHNAREFYQKAYEYSLRTPWHVYRGMSAYNLAGTLSREAQSQVEIARTRELLEKAVSLGEESLKWFNIWSSFEGDFLGGSWIANFYQELANVSDSIRRRKLMARSLALAQRAEKLVSNKSVGLSRYKLVNLGDIFMHNAEYYRQLALQARQNESKKNEKAITLLRKALENCLKSKKYHRDEAYSSRKVDSSLLAGDVYYELMNTEGQESAKRRLAGQSRRLFHDSIRISKQQGWNERIAESSWRIAQVYDKESDFESSATCYLEAHSSYELARSSSDNPRTYVDPSNYMLAWEKIERAKLAHKASKFESAAELYLEAYKLVSATRRWHALANLYRAEALIEKAEELSLADDQRSSVERFAEAGQILAKLRSDLRGNEILDSQSAGRIAKQLASFCDARIILEKSKQAYKLGDTEQSVRGLGDAEATFNELSEGSLISDSLRSNELKSLASLCKALKSFQLAQMEREPRLYLEAKQVFQLAAEESKSNTLKPLLSGLANFANFLYYSDQVERSLDRTLDVQQIMECNRSLDSAEVMFRKLGNRSFLAMLKASKHILDATIKMSAAEREMESASTKAKLYGQAQRYLSLASKYYQELGSSKRVKESLKMIGAVRNHQRLIPLARDIIAEMASDQIIYAAISTSSLLDESPENSARELDSAFLVLDIDLPKPFIGKEETLEFTLTISNIGKESALTVKIDDAIPEDFELGPGQSLKQRSMPIAYRIAPGSTRTIALSAKPMAAGDFSWHPSLVYLDGISKYKVAKSQVAKVVVESNTLADFGSLLSEKSKLEEELRLLQGQDVALREDEERQAEAIVSLREKISRIEEEVLRTKNEYERMTVQLEQIRADLNALRQMKNESVNEEDKARLESEEKLLEYRIERRRTLLQQASLL
jgi:uncharacterized repeat protein (TIGR01451 family)